MMAKILDWHVGRAREETIAINFKLQFDFADYATRASSVLPTEI